MAHADIPSGQEPRRGFGALTLLRDESGRVLVVKASYHRQPWQLPGGGAAENEPPHVARWRELLEETAVSQPATGRLLVVDYTPPSLRTGAVERVNFLFDGGVLAPGTRIALPPARGEEEPELTAYRWLERAQVREECDPRQARRILAALAVLDDPASAPRYLVLSKKPPLVNTTGKAGSR